MHTALKQVGFKVQDRFCNAEELKQSDELLTFFSKLCDIKKTKLIEDYHNKTVSDDVKNNAKNNQFPGKYLKIGSLFQIMYYNLHNGKKKNVTLQNECMRNLRKV